MGQALLAENIYKSFGPLDVLKGLTLSADDGDVVSIIGASGSGKSTFLRCINFLETPDKGRIVLDGEEVIVRTDGRGRLLGADPKQINRLRTQLGMVFQGFNLWSHMSVLQNVMEGPLQVLGRGKAEVHEAGMEMLAKVGIADKCDMYPAQLSGGQQQRVAIARALAMEPKVLLFDEPTSALDPELVGGVLKVMQEMRESGMTMLVVSHEMRFARQAADRIVFMDHGEILEQGPPEEFFDSARHPRVQEFLASIDR